MIFYHALTLTAVVFANVMFRAESPGDAFAIWAGMIRFDEILMLPQVFPTTQAELFGTPLLLMLVACTIIFLCPNTQQIMGRYRPILHWERWQDVAPAWLSLEWRPNLFWAIYTGLTLTIGLIFIMRGQTEFIYFNF